MNRPSVTVLASLLLLASCGQSGSRALQGTEIAPPGDFSFLGRTAPCHLEVPAAQLRVIRVNCFHVDGILHIHSNRFARLPRFTGESWVDTVTRTPNVRISIAGYIYRMRATVIETAGREEILHSRGYVYAWDGITVFRFDSKARARF